MSNSSSGSTMPTPSPTEDTPKPRRRLTFILGITLALLVAALGYGLFNYMTRPQQPVLWNFYSTPSLPGFLGDLTGDYLNDVLEISTNSSFSGPNTIRILTDENVRWITSNRHLELITFRQCDFSLVTIQGFEKLFHLEIVETRNSNITDTHLAQILRAPNLDSLEISDYIPHFKEAPVANNASSSSGPPPLESQLTAQALEHISEAPKLEVLYLAKQKFKDVDFQYLTANNLKILSIRHSQITGQALEHISKLNNLVALVLNNNPIQDQTLRYLAHHPTLAVLNLSSTPITDTALKHINAISHLRHLDLGDTAVTDEGLKQLADLKNLTGIDLNDTQVTGTGLAHLAYLNNIDLDGAPVTDEGLLPFTQSEFQGEIDLSNTRITSLSLKRLSAMPKLQKITVDKILYEKHVDLINQLSTSDKPQIIAR